MSGDVMLRSANQLVDSWQRRCPDSLLDPPAIWDDVISNRFVSSDTDIHWNHIRCLLPWWNCCLIQLNPMIFFFY